LSDQTAAVLERSEGTASRYGGLGISVSGFCRQWETEIATALREGYRLSRTFRALVDAWLIGRGPAIAVEYEPGVCRARPGRVEFDPAVPTGVSRGPEPVAMQDEQRAALFHELARALDSGRQGGAPDCTAQGHTTAERVLEELGLLSPFASVVPATLALTTLSYEGRWHGAVPLAGSARRVAGSNVVYLPHVSKPPAPLNGGTPQPGCTPRTTPPAALMAATSVAAELASDLLPAQLVDLEALGPAGRCPYWSAARWSSRVS
jgi:hypothetical protein